MKLIERELAGLSKGFESADRRGGDLCWKRVQ